MAGPMKGADGYSPAAREAILEKIRELQHTHDVKISGKNTREAPNNRFLLDYLQQIQLLENPLHSPEEMEAIYMTQNEWSRKFNTGRAKDFPELWDTLVAFIHQFDACFTVENVDQNDEPDVAPIIEPTLVDAIEEPERRTLSAALSNDRPAAGRRVGYLLAGTACVAALAMLGLRSTTEQLAPEPALPASAPMSQSDGTPGASRPDTSEDQAPETTQAKISLPMPSGQASAMEFSDDGRFIAVADSSLAIRVYFAETGLLAAALHGHEDAVRSLDFSPDGDFLASGALDGTARVWSLAQRKQIRVFTDRRRARSLRNPSTLVRFSPDGATLAVGGKAHEVVLYRVGDGVLLRSLQTNPRQDAMNQRPPECAGQSLSPSPECVRALRAQTSNVESALKAEERGLQPVQDIEFSADGRYIATISYGSWGDLQIFDLQEGETLIQTQLLLQYGIEPLNVAFSPAGQTLAILGKRRTTNASPERVALRLNFYDLKRRRPTELSHEGPFERSAMLLDSLSLAPDFSWNGELVSYPTTRGYLVYDVNAGLVAREEDLGAQARFAQLAGSAPIRLAVDAGADRPFEVQIQPFGSAIRE